MTDISRDDIARGRELLSQMMPRELSQFGGRPVPEDQFGRELGDFAMAHAFAHLWDRPGLSRRERSLVTLGMLIGLRAEEELRVHVGIARRNGLTREEIAEVVYHSSAYAGFPAASAARRVADAALAVADPAEPGGGRAPCTTTA